MNRKKFIEHCSVIGTGAVLSPLLQRSGILGPALKDKIKVAIIGCGSVSGVYLPHLTKSPYVELVSVCDIKPVSTYRPTIGWCRFRPDDRPN
jgi:hypothetical protein